ncbi:helix-turn-helix domain-containing protein [Hafnia alvei]|uniref:helix-turn-helix domain-containing protein n=1 Tax=Hafnia alvei TaxID=569 RepID=UPI00396C9F65
MALVSVTEAARLTGKNRATIHRYIKQGKLSQSTDATGAKKVETSELLRVFGTISASPATVLQCDVIGVSLEIGNFCTLSALFNQSWFVSG